MEYILSRVKDVNFICLSETWINPNEPDLIQNTINQQVISKNNGFVVFNKCETDTNDDYSYGRPHGRVMDNISYELLICNTHNLVVIVLKYIMIEVTNH